MPEDRVHKLVRGFFASEVSAEAIEAMEAWLREDPANTRTLAEFVMLDGLLLVEQKNIDATAILASLLDAEQNAPLALVDVTPEPHAGRRGEMHEDQTITLRQLLFLSGYLARKGLRKPAFLKAAAAAVFLLSAIMLIVMQSGSASQPTGQPDELATHPDPALTRAGITPVATLTAERGAVWDRRPGEDLYTGQRFTLTQGFAEITTLRGALAVIEAPTTIEIIGDNRVALTRGTLIGRCPAIASRGFTVDTPTAQIVDVGTRFGVAVDHAGETALEVFTGEVSAAPVIGGRVKPATLVVSGQAARVGGGEVVLSPAPDPNASRFSDGIAFEHGQLMRGPSLIAYYGFDESGDGVLRESRGKTLFDAEIVGAEWVEGRAPGKHALNFSGKAWEERVALSQQASERLKLQGDFTITMWVNIRSLPEGRWSAVATKGNDSWRLLVNRDRKTSKPQIGFHWSQGKEDPSMQYVGVVTQDIELDHWHHVVITGRSDRGGEGAAVRLYLDGQFKAEKHFPRRMESESLVAFAANSKEQEKQVFDGILGETAIFDRAISEDEIGMIYSADSAGGRP
ncbi:MAG: FecR domain-containing protein [Phycisphaeraceae bacterium]|nr:FecR domain-containing protein [Phycisphaeraceae bacterium]